MKFEWYHGVVIVAVILLIIWGVTQSIPDPVIQDETTKSISDQLKTDIGTENEIKKRGITQEDLDIMTGLL